MERKDIKIGQRVSFYFKGKNARYYSDLGITPEEPRMVHGFVKKLHRTNAEIWEKITPELRKKYDYRDEYLVFYVHPSELIKETKIKISDKQRRDLKVMQREKKKIRDAKKEVQRTQFFSKF